MRAPIAASPLRCWSMGRAPMAQPPGSETRAGPYRATSGITGGNRLLAVLLAQTAQDARLAAALLGADLVAVMGAKRAPAPCHVVLAAVALRTHRQLALLGAAGRSSGRSSGRRGLGSLG